MISRLKLFRISVVTATTAVVALLVVAVIVSTNGLTTSAATVFTPAGLVNGVTITRNTSSSATDPNSYNFTESLTGMQSKLSSVVRISLVKVTYNNTIQARLNYLDSAGNSALSAPSYTCSWINDAAGRKIGFTAVFYYSIAGQKLTVSVRPGTNPLTNTATNVLTFKATNYGGTVVFFDRTGYFMNDRTTVVYR